MKERNTVYIGIHIMWFLTRSRFAIIVCLFAWFCESPQPVIKILMHHLLLYVHKSSITARRTIAVIRHGCAGLYRL